MAITPSDFSKIWASNADTTEYTFSEANYLKGWDFVGNLPPTRAQWNAIQKRTDEKMKYVFDNFGAPLIAPTVADMTLQNRVYVYTGSEVGYTAGHWYYWDGSAWTDGGVYNSNTLQVDNTLTVSSAAADAKVTGDRIKTNTDNLKNYNILDVLNYNAVDSNSASTYSVSVTWDKNTGTLIADGTATGNGFFNLVNSTSSLPYGMEAGRQYYLDLSTTNENLRLRIYFFKTDGTNPSTNYTASQLITIPDNCKGIVIRAQTTNGKTYNNDVMHVKMLTLPYTGYKEDFPLDLLERGTRVTSGDINDLNYPGSWFCYSEDVSNVENLPVQSAGRLIYMTSTGYNTDASFRRGFQFYYTVISEIYYRAWTGLGWFDWKKIGEGEGGGTVTVNNTYNINTSPTITTDTNGWLVAVDDEDTDEANATDMTGAIMSMLTDTGYCHLGVGTFYVSGNIDMPENSILEGCGNKTIIKLLDSVTAGYVVKIGSFCRLQNLEILGSKTMPSFTSVTGTRHGIYFIGNGDGTEGGTEYQTGPAYISNVHVKWFSGSAVYCHNTSINYLRGLYVTDCLFERCWCGININYRSEFHRYVNCNTSHCYIGCINNGGNNGFVNCIFHAQTIGFLIDNSNDDKPNNAHGYMTCCTFGHIGNNTGSAITIKNIVNGFLFDSCQIHFCSVNITDSDGVTFSNSCFGRGIVTGYGAAINISGGNLIMFNGCVFINATERPPQINITNNTKVKFINCYDSVSGDAVTQ